MKNTTAYLPLRLLKTVSDAYPLAWEQMKTFHDNNGIGLPRWESWCYAPMAAAYSVASQCEYPKTIEEGIFYAKKSAEIAALAPWRLSKEVFSIDQDLEQLLYEQDGDDLPSSVLLQLPYQAFYVQTNCLDFDGIKYHGFFVHLEHDMNNNDRELRILLLDEDCNTMAIPIHVDEKNIGDSLRTTLDQARNNMLGNHEYLRKLITTTDYIKNLEMFYQKILQVILYIMSVNADISKSPEQDTVMKRRNTIIRDKYSEVRKWDVGVRIGAPIRAYNSNHEDSEPYDQTPVDHTNESLRNSPRPHIRRAHWHHYWTGKKDGVSERKLILKWQAPTFIGAQDDMPVTIHNIKADLSSEAD